MDNLFFLNTVIIVYLRKLHKIWYIKSALELRDFAKETIYSFL